MFLITNDLQYANVPFLSFVRGTLCLNKPILADGKLMIGIGPVLISQMLHVNFTNIYFNHDAFCIRIGS